MFWFWPQNFRAVLETSAKAGEQVTVRTRIAPSPTGDPHVGTAYIALFNYCFARQHGGQFILRIEDTDQVRSTQESEQMILDSLRWTGLQWDEGPDVGGPHGPYRQSERSELYLEHAQKLLDADHAFKCFCTQQDLTEMRQAQKEANQDPRYDGRCSLLTAEERAQREAAGEPFVVRMKVPDEGTCVVNDMLRGEIAIEWKQVDMQILLKSDGLPTYHLANVVDDHHMQITHVMRGEEWINSAPKHLLLYKYFGWDAPTLCHLPLLRNPDKSKLSKRKNPTSILYYKRIGVLPEALLNYLGRMGWSMPDEREKFTIDEMLEAFDITRVSLGGPVFDVTKLEWLNGQWIRDLDLDSFAASIQTWAFNREYLMKIAPLLQNRVKTLGEIGPMASFFFSKDVTLNSEMLIGKSSPEDVIKHFQWALWGLDELRVWDKHTVESVMRSTAELTDAKLKVFLQPFFVALTGSASSTPLFDTMEVLGSDISRARFRSGIKHLTDGRGLGNKKLKKMRKSFDSAKRAHASATTPQP